MHVGSSQFILFNFLTLRSPQFTAANKVKGLISVLLFGTQRNENKINWT
jgi:hypothetical protein